MADVNMSLPLPDFLSGLTRIAPIAIFRADAQGRVTYLSDRWSELSGLTPDESLGYGWTAALDAAESTRVLASWRAAAAAGRQFAERYRVGTATGAPRLVEVHAVALAAGQGLVGVVQDLTELEHALEAREAAVRALDATRRRWQAVFDHALDAFVLADDEGRYVDVNPAALQLFGLSREAMLDSSVDRLSAASAGTFQDAWRSFLADGKASGEYPIRRADGEQRDVEFRAVARILPGIHLSVLRDVTDRKRAERAQAAALQRLQVLSAIDDAVLQASSIEQVAELVAARIGPLFQADAAAVVLLDEQGRVRACRFGGSEQHAARWLVPDAAGAWSRLLDGELVAVGGPVTQADPIAGRPIAPFDEYVMVPVRASSRTMGILALGWRGATESVLPHHAMAREIADRLAVALAHAQLNADLLAGNAEMRMLARQLADSRELERRTIARELHDEVGQALTALKLSLQGVGRVGADDRRAGAPVQLVSELIDRVRCLTLDLSPPLLDELGLHAALSALIDRLTRATDLRVSLDCRLPAERLGTAVETAVYRAVQEALTNVIRHAGARHACVICRSDATVLVVCISDDGNGYDPGSVAPESSGLSGLRARLAPLGGTLVVDAEPGRGIAVIARLPLGSAQEG